MNDAGMATRTGSSVSALLADYVATTGCADIPAHAVDCAKLFLLDTLAVAWAGSDAPGCREVFEMMRDQGGRPEAMTWAYGARLPASTAAFVNGMSSGALDYDALGRDAPVHVNIVVLPAALAIAERQRTSGRDFLAALVVGSDIAYRVAAACTHPPRGFHFTSAASVFGAAAAAAKLLGLDATGIRHALGIAYTQVSGTKQVMIEPSLSKRTLSAFAARAGVDAALMAQRGITAPGGIFEGEFGFFRLYENGDPARLLDALGSRFDSVDLSVKQFPSCGCNHTTLAAMLRFIRRYDLAPDDVTAVEVTVPPEIDRLVGMPYDPSGDAQVAAQFSIRYSIACALVRRRLGLAEIQESAARDPAIAAHIGKVTLKVDPTLRGSRGPIELRVQTRTHGELACREEHVPGSREAPLEPRDIDDKFNECFGLGVSPLADTEIETLTRRTNALETVADMATFFDGIARPA